MKKEIRIHAGDESRVEKAIRRLNKHAAKMDYSECSIISVGKPYETLRTYLTPIDTIRGKEFIENKVAFLVSDVVLEIPEQFLDYDSAEWKVIGRVVNAEGQAEVVAEPSFLSVIGKAVEGYNFKCDSCKHGLGRAFAIQHRVDSKILVVGSECLNKYTGADGHAIVSAIEFLSLVVFKEEDFDKEGCGGGRSYKVIDIEDFLAVAVAAAEKDGGYQKRWIQDKHGYGEPCHNYNCTRNKALVQMIGQEIVTDGVVTAKKWNDFQFDLLAVSDAHKAKAVELVAAWGAVVVPEKPVDGEESINDYKLQCKFLAERGWVTEKTAGIAASMVNAPKSDKLSTSVHVGVIGERQDFILKVTGSHEIEGQYGVTTIVRFEDKDSNVFTWFASGSQSFYKDEEVKVKATIKAHDEYKGTKQTIITRAKVLVK